MALSDDFFLRRPLVGFGLTFVLGTLGGLTLDVPAAPVFRSAVVALLGACVLAGAARLRRRSASPAATFCLYLCVLFAAWYAVTVHPTDNPAAAEDLAALDGRALRVVGVVAGDPDAGLPAARGYRQWKFPLLVEEAAADGTPHAWQGPIVVRWRTWGDRPPPAYGERWTLSGRARVYPPAGVRKKRLYLTVTPRDRQFLSAGHGGWLAQRCYTARQAAAGCLAAGIGDHPREVGILQALILGYRERLTDPMQDLFAASGTLHIFAISGSHVVVIGGLIVFALRSLRVSRVFWVLILGPLLAAYTLATGGEPSAVRACIMAVAYFLAPLLGRRTDVASALALAAIVILAWSPAQLFEAGFLCSFVVVIGLVLLCPVLERPLRRLYEPDPFRLQPEARGVVLLRRLGRQAGMLLALNVAAWLASTPLTALYFGRFTPISLLSNFIVIPVSSVVILTGCLSMLLGPCLAWFADVFNHANLFLIVVMVKGTEALMKIPGGSTLIGPLPPWPAAAWYAALAAWLLWRRGKMVDTSRAE